MGLDVAVRGSYRRTELLGVDPDHDHLLGAAGGRQQLRRQRRLVNIVCEVPQRHQHVRLAAAKAGAQAHRCPGLIGVGQSLEDGGDHFLEWHGRVRIAKELSRVLVHIRRAAGHYVAKIGGKDGVLQVAFQHLSAWDTRFTYGFQG